MWTIQEPQTLGAPSHWGEGIGDGPPHFCECDLQKLNPVLTVSIRGENPLLPPAGRMGNNHSGKQQNILFYSVVHGRNLNQSPTDLVRRKDPAPFDSSLSHGGREVPNSSPCQPSSPPLQRNWEALVNVTVQRCRHTETYS